MHTHAKFYPIAAHTISWFVHGLQDVLAAFFRMLCLACFALLF
ncbi:hypothetical protein HMPREF3192_00390 [Atopobium deltae]|uniref:Uncharacterized protein n=1 Tax=Atopobium deltae TaxID=1393034 RepID=A0A133XWK4_9ACTN|nr:hypothetical protein HMPREF3192_00390 [Atopobium deltae]